MSDIRALLLTDVVDSTRLAETLGDAAMARLWTAHDRLARELLPPHRGREIDKTDGMLLLFEDAADALAYAAAYHAALATLEPPLRARAGLHVGAVLLRENPADDVARGAKPLEVDGLAKPIAARVMALAGGGQTLLSRDAAQSLAQFELHSHGHWLIKGVAEPIEICERADTATAPPRDNDKALRVVRSGERWIPLREVPGNLPEQASSFVGREHELAELKTALRGSRLVTLLGMGGLGKTRLSLELAAMLRADYPDGTWFLDLSRLQEPARVVEEAAQLLQIKDEPGRPLLQAMGEQLRQRRLLLVVDNCEHLVEAAAALVHALLRAAPALRIVASSRSALHVPGETLYAVSPLPLPAPGDDAQRLAGSTAVRLFAERARAQRADFALDATTLPQVAELVARLEGIPLALELAAARVRSLSVAEINQRLGDRYRLLTGGSRVLQQRQQTLRALVDWSYDLLQPAEQTLFQRLAPFAGGFDLAAAEAVCGADPLDPLDILDGIESLIDKSLVTAERSGVATRYRMLETLRDYARGKLEGSGDAAATARRHCEHYWDLAKHVRNGLFGGAEQAEWARRGEADLDNLRAAMALARAGGADPLLAAKMPVALQGFWVMRGRIAEGRELVRAALAAVHAGPLERAHILYVGAALAHTQGDAAQALQQLETCLALRRAEGGDADVALTLSTMAMAQLATGHAEAALRSETEALGLLRRAGHRVGETVAQLHLAEIAVHRDSWDEALAHGREALALAREVQNREYEGESEWLLAVIPLMRGGDADADHLQRSLDLCLQVGDRIGAARALLSQGEQALREGRIEAARGRLGDALRAFQAYEMRAEAIEGLEMHAELAAALARHDVALQLRAAGEAARQALGLGLPPYRERRREERLAALRQQLGTEEQDRLWSQGSLWTLSEALAAALALTPSSPSSQPATPA
ncbi:MAG: hypothetical protein KGN16_12375 [Burkholderiales bacterium]|nr:hypothetical protein [Burkholderiales bacterium]